VHYLIIYNVHKHKIEVKKMGYRHRNMYNLTGLPGWIRLGFSPGWKGRSPTGLPPAAQWILQSGNLPHYIQSLQTTTPTPLSTTLSTKDLKQPTPYIEPLTPTYTKEQEKQMLEQQVKIFENQLETINKRLKELEEDK
jgi:hypothetical protein